jgi:hypothetical protein
MTDQSAGLLTEEQRRQIEQAIQGALLGPVPKLYANGFGLAQTASDLSVILMLHGQPTAVLTMSYVTAKSLVADVSSVLAGYEASTKQQLRTIADLTAEMTKQTGAPSSVNPPNR